MTLLNILICHIPERYDYLKRLNGILDPQLNSSVKVIIDDSRYKMIGRKRNDLLARADGKYVCFIDDDDRISENYIQLLMQGIKNNVDCCSLKGEITDDGENPRVFLHSLKYKSYYEENGIYYRYPNHLNCVKTSIAKQFRFMETNHGEDTDFATQMFKAGAIKTEHEINETIYYYDCRSDDYERLELIELKKQSA